MATAQQSSAGPVQSSVTPPGGEPPAPARDSAARRRLTVVLLVTMLLSAVVAALVVAKLVSQRDTAPPSPAQGETATTAPATSAPLPAVGHIGDPAFEIHPQRAPAGPPLTLNAWGVGCAGTGGELSVTRIGAANDTADLERLVVRVPLDVASNGAWSATTLLVGQPPGAYRVAASCDEQPVARGLQPVAERRDVATATEMLELTGPALVDTFEVQPTAPAANQAVVVTLSASGRCPAGSQVAGAALPAADAPGRARAFQTTVGPDGHWVASLPFSTSDAAGSYSVQATCSAGFAYATEVVTFGANGSSGSTGNGPSPRPTAAPVTTERVPGGAPFTG